MHIPDGYLGPITCVAGYAVMLPVWAIAAKKVKKTLQAKQVPLLAIGAAFCFVIMMFNIPIPGGTTGHAVGGALAAILLGPWAACIAVSVALAIQALLFGDGGITSLGANCFNMAFVLPFSGYLIYKMVSGRNKTAGFRRIAAAFVAGYTGLVLCALFTGIEFGLQPLLHHTASGQPLYCPYGLAVAVSTMVFTHAFVFAWIEGAVTGLAVKYIQTQEPFLLQTAPFRITTKLWLVLIILALISPLGLVLPAFFNAHSAWGEWSLGEIHRLAGFVPQGLKNYAGIWNAPLSGYEFNNLAERGFILKSLAYIASAVSGIAIIAGLFFITRKLLANKNGAPKKTSNALERTLLAIFSLLKETVTGDLSASSKGFLQNRDPRVKCLSFFILIATALFTRSLLLLAALYLFTLVLAMASRIRLVFFLKRTWFFIPLFSLCIVIPALFSSVTPGQPLATLGGVAITRQGVGAGAIFFLRVLVSVSLIILLMLSTRHHVLLKALRSFKIPALFIMTMSMCYRYIFLLLDTVQKTFIAIKSRVGFMAAPAEARALTAKHMAGLWLRSYRLHLDVYNAMLARGYSGDIQVMDDFKTHAKDILVLASAFIILTGTLWLNQYLP